MTQDERDRVENLEHTVFGNDKPGLKADVIVIQERTRGMPERISRLEKAVYSVGGALFLIEIAPGAVELAKHLLGIK